MVLLDLPAFDELRHFLLSNLKPKLEVAQRCFLLWLALGVVLFDKFGFGAVVIVELLDVKFELAVKVYV